MTDLLTKAACNPVQQSTITSFPQDYTNKSTLNLNCGSNYCYVPNKQKYNIENAQYVKMESSTLLVVLNGKFIDITVGSWNLQWASLI